MAHHSQPEAWSAQTQAGAQPCRVGGLVRPDEPRPNPSST